MAALEGISVTKSYGKNQVLNNVTLAIDKGELVTLLGPSGCGKTTLLRAIAGLIDLEHGRILIDGRDVTRTPIHRRRIGMVFQSHALFPHMTVNDNVGFGLRMQGVDRSARDSRIRDVLSLVRLSDFQHRMPHELSGGQQQRVAIARAIATNPSVLLLDEPFGALDRKLRETLQVELRALTKQLSMTAVFVTHDQDEAVVLSDRIAVMNAGVIQQIDTPQSVFEAPTNYFVADFMGFQNFFEARVSTVDRAATELQSGPYHFEAETTGSGVGADVVVGIRAERIRIVPRDAQIVTVSEVNTVPGEIIGSIYRGEFNVYSVHTKIGMITVRAETGSNMQPAGRLVTLSWDSSSLKILQH